MDVVNAEQVRMSNAHLHASCVVVINCCPPCCSLPLGAHSRGSWRVRSHGTRACACRYSRCRRCRAHGKCEASSPCIIVLEHMPLGTFSLFQSDPHMIKEIVEAVSIPVMAKVRIGHFVEAQVMSSLRYTYLLFPSGNFTKATHKTYLRVIPLRYYKASGLTTSTSRKC